MVDINTEGLEIAPLSEEQIETLNQAQSQLNELAKIKQEIYLLAVTQKSAANES
ncbi:hypothetical protein [Desulforamulus hydrothermalis]|uniref:Uncharacterized protein n=1 Tax=Desulforamulus hydrothermalis Lam5 = DSM 18033 TaxID=1121428 RepID=K8DZW1_9FIRM|nr:hypothetical protein [Desulforamulus hydrothermalis]CCO08702.1 conserved hypothetical protein [Desulforamulus hydrothermalis Lam5 = DSM 18033]SHG69561.1 hypothetical protein SAMN02745177_00010 [Desulforamulus hydrothermalis Lam5 = DSM 18033]